MARPRTTFLAFIAIALILAASIAVLGPTSKTKESPLSMNEPREVTAAIQATEAEAGRDARARWEDRRERIRAAHAPHERGEAPPGQAPSSRGCTDADCSSDAAEDGGDRVFAAFIDETTTLTQGCEDLIVGKPTSVRINARLIGAPDIGTIVESIEVEGPAEHVDALTECLTEGMYTMEFGEAATNFERDAVLMLGLLDEVAGEGWMTSERVAEVRQQMIDGGLDLAADPMVVIGADDPSPAP